MCLHVFWVNSRLRYRLYVIVCVFFLIQYHSIHSWKWIIITTFMFACIHLFIRTITIDIFNNLKSIFKPQNFHKLNWNRSDYTFQLYLWSIWLIACATFWSSKLLFDSFFKLFSGVMISWYDSRNMQFKWIGHIKIFCNWWWFFVVLSFMTSTKN